MARDKYALEGPEATADSVAKIMLEALQARQRNETNTAQRAAMLREMALQQRGPAGRASKEAEEAEKVARDDWWGRQRSMERITAEDADIREAQKSMANAPGRGLQGGQDQITADMMDLDPILDIGYQGGGAAAIGADRSTPWDWGISGREEEEAALAAQMEADATEQGFGFVRPEAQANISVDTAGTPGGFTTGDNQYVENLAQQEQFPQAFAGQGNPRFGGTELGMVPAGRRSDQGFSAVDYIPGDKQVQEQNIVSRDAKEWLSTVGLKEGAQGDPNVVPESVPGLDPNVAGATTSSGSSQFTEQHRFGAKDYDQSGQQQGGVVATGLGDSQGLSPQERQILQQEIAQLEANRTDAGSEFPSSIGGKQLGEVQEVSGAEQNVAIVKSLLRELEVGGIGVNELRRAGIDVGKFLSGVYNMADVDKLMVLAKRAGAPPSTRARIQTMSDNVAGTSGRGFNWEDQKYDEGVSRRQEGPYGRAQEEDFMDYTKRMHQRYKDMSSDPDSAWVAPNQG